LHFNVDSSHQIIEHTFVDTNQKGSVAELAFAKEAVGLGLDVLRPLTEHGRYDLALDLGHRIVRVQCKWARREGDVVRVGISTSRRSREGFLRRSYTACEVDAIGAYCADLDQCFLIPIGLVEGQSTVRLRLVPARNGQRAALHFADE
jgi:hypothetical protein